MRSFLIVWVGQLVSITGTTLTGFGMQFFGFTETRSVTDLTFVALAFAVPGVVLAPLAGAIVDRVDRRVAMLASDAVAGLATLFLALLFFTDNLELWHIYLATGVGSTANTFQEPAWMASIPLLVNKDQLGRANGLVQLNQGLSIVIAPVAAGILLVAFGLGGVLIVDAATFAIGVAALAVVKFPRPERIEPEQKSIIAEAAFGWRYLRERPGLFGLLWVYGGTNFMLSFSNVLLIPLIVSFASEAAAGGVLSAAGAGVIAGSLIVSVWGGPKRLIRGVMLGIFFGGISMTVTGLRASVPLIVAGVVALMVLVPIVKPASNVLWQTKVAPAVQGRVFSLRRMISQALSPIAILLAGPLADNVFGPLLEDDGSLADSLGSVFGTGSGRGIGLLISISGIGTMTLAIVGYLMPRVRNVESEIPDQFEDEPDTNREPTTDNRQRRAKGPA
jgi:MFS family permease